MVINEAKPDDAISKLGKPDEDKVDRLRIFDIDNKLITPEIKKNQYRHLTWKKLDGFKQVRMAFKDERLLYVYLWLDKEKQFAASTLAGLYGVEFQPKTTTIGEIFSGPIGGSPLSGKKHTPYPDVYSLIGRVETNWVSATIFNGGFKHVMLGDGDTSKETGAFPGKVGAVQIVSRTLENRTGGDVLK